MDDKLSTRLLPLSDLVLRRKAKLGRASRERQSFVDRFVSHDKSWAGCVVQRDAKMLASVVSESSSRSTLRGPRGQPHDVSGAGIVNGW